MAQRLGGQATTSRLPHGRQHWLALLRAAGLGCLALLAASCADEPDVPVVQRAPGVLVRLSNDEVQSLDPHKVSTVDDTRIATELFEGLTRHTADGRVEPGLAERWTVSPDGLVWRFTLRPRLRFSDGSPLTADDVVASLRRLLAPGTTAPNANLHYAIENAEAVAKGTLPPEQLAVRALSADTIEIRLDRPLPAFVELMAHASAVVLPSRLIAARGDDWIKQRPLVSSGPFRLKQWRLHSALELERNPYYHDAANVHLRGVSYLPTQNDQTALRLFRAGAADVMTDFSPRELPLLRESVPQAIRVAPYRGSYYFTFNTRKPPFNDVRVRRALAMTVDRKIMVEKVIGLNAPVAYSIVPPGLGGYGSAVLPGYAGWPMEKRMAEARRLLAAAGYGPENPLTFEIRYNTDTEHRRVSLALSQMWKPLGVIARLANAEAAVHFSSLKAGDFTMARSGWIADYAGAENFLSVFLSDAGPLNYSGYNNPSFDAQVRAALAMPDPMARNAALRAAETMLVEDVPMLPLNFYVSRNLVGPNVRGWIDNIANYHPSRTLRLEASVKPKAGASEVSGHTAAPQEKRA